MTADSHLPEPRALDALPNLPASLSWRPVALLTGDDGGDGMLVFWSERLIAVLSRVDIDRVGRASLWHLEVGFGECAGPPSGLIFHTLAQGLRWLAECMQSFAG